MSAEASGWVWRHSPFTGATKLVHLAIADSVNDQNHNEFWMSMGNLAYKASVDRRTAIRAVAQLVEGRYLIPLDENDKRDKTGKSNRYRMAMAGVITREMQGVTTDHTSDDGEGVTSDHTGVTTDHTQVGHLVPEGVTPRHPNPIEPNLLTQDEPNLAPVAQIAERRRDLVFEALADACGWDWRALPGSSRGVLGKAVKELKSVDATPQEIFRRAAIYADRYGAEKLTPLALVKHWPSLTIAIPAKPSDTKLRRSATAIDNVLGGTQIGHPAGSEGVGSARRELAQPRTD